MIPDNLLYTTSHEWVRLEGDIATVGITHYAQEALGDVVFIELPNVGRLVMQGDTVAVVESVKAASDIYSPVNGEIVEVNTALVTAPEGVNTSPYEAGWFLRVKLSQAITNLLGAARYHATLT
jgi:glycine cleavage system H protein